jgi:FAD/FMN-containing dehydrogenase
VTSKSWDDAKVIMPNQVLSKARPAPGALSAQWHTIKSAGLAAVIANGGTVTHHHAVGRDHRRWYDRQRPSLFAAALRAKSAGLDAVIANGGTVTHHHPVGRDHRRWYDRQRPSLFALRLVLRLRRGNFIQAVFDLATQLVVAESA